MGKGLTAIAVQTLACPAAWVQSGLALGPVVAAEEIAHAASVLRYPCPPVDQLTAQLRDEISAAGNGSTLSRAVLVPSGKLPAVATSRWDTSELAVFDAEVLVPSDGLILIASPWPLNETSPATPLRVSSNSERSQGRRFAEDSGADAAYWLNLRGEVARVDEWTIAAVVDDVVVVPTIGSGAPFDPWTDRLAEGGFVRRSTLTQEAVRDERVPLAAVLPWGEAVPCGISKHQVELSEALASDLNRALQALT